jgi:hypothetical protein
MSQDWKPTDENADILDSRDLSARLDYLTSTKEGLELALGKADQDLADERARLLALDDHEDHDAELEPFEDELEKAGEALREWQEGEEYAEWKELDDNRDDIETGARNGEGFIAESHFTEYCKELCSDIGDLPEELPDYIERNINWDGVAEDLKADYSTVTMFGNDYYYRNC